MPPAEGFSSSVMTTFSPSVPWMLQVSLSMIILYLRSKPPFKRAPSSTILLNRIEGLGREGKWCGGWELSRDSEWNSGD